MPERDNDFRHPLTPDYPTDAFSGTAEDYARHRPRYPEELVAALENRIGADGTGRLLDLACGTGEVAFALHEVFAEIWAVDLEPEMIALAERRSREIGLVKVRWMVGRAEDLVAPRGHFRAITAGRAFHRLEKRAIMPRIREWLQPGGFFVDLGSDSNVSYPNEPWLEIAAETIARWRGGGDTGGINAAAAPPPGPEMTTQEVLEASGFTDIEERRVDVPYRWSLDDFVGYVFSRSVTSRAAFGVDAEPFESDLRQRLLAHDPSGVYAETLRAYYVLARLDA